MNNNLKNTHLVVEIDLNDDIIEESIISYNNIKVASDYVEDNIKKNPHKTFKIYQLRSVMKGNINIEREDFNS